MLEELAPIVHRQARRICSGSPQLVEDAYQEGRIHLWTCAFSAEVTAVGALKEVGVQLSSGSTGDATPR